MLSHAPAPRCGVVVGFALFNPPPLSHPVVCGFQVSGFDSHTRKAGMAGTVRACYKV